MNDGEVRRKTARFAQVVKEAGTPEPYTLWQAPDNDPGFQRAIKEKRVMTVFRETVGTKKDYGLAGYHQGANVSYFIFPKPLRAFERNRIVGVKYQLLGQSKPIGAIVKAQEVTSKVENKRGEPPVAQSTSKTLVPEKPREKIVKRFLVEMVVLARTEAEEEVEAENQKEAKRIAQERLRQTKPDLWRGTVKIRVGRIKPVNS